jgi:hypothetical protein
MELVGLIAVHLGIFFDFPWEAYSGIGKLTVDTLL